MNNKALEIVNNCEKNLKKTFDLIENTALNNQKKVLDAFRKNNVAARHFAGTNGYGYDDIGRNTLCRLFADVLGGEDAIVSPLLVSGTHAISTMLFGILRPNDKFVAISGMPYDTLTDVILGKNIGSLDDYGIKFDKIDLTVTPQTVEFDTAKIEQLLKNDDIKMVFIQRSRGYNWRSALSCNQIADIVKTVKSISPKTIVAVDNCYGEFVEEQEPLNVGADIMAGSLIKNIGGGIAPTGGYIAGRKDLIEICSYRLTAPSIGMEVGSYAYGYPQMYEGLFLAPSVVKNALKACCLFSAVYRSLGFDTQPDCDVTRPYDIVTSIRFNDSKSLIDFIRSIQGVSPVDSNLLLEPWDMPGYQHQVIMAAGTFVQGSSIELSADAPIKEPYIAYVQGGLTYEHAKIAVIESLERLKLV
ncbi:MAG: methionine gamma-lyase family protein [Eubacteriales bacterium]|nr:methionine gamma-lyase family protein [Eubacteriales bacterium]